MLRGLLLLLWALLAFGPAWFARDLDTTVAGWPLNYWLCAQGAVFGFIAIVAIHARAGRGREDAAPGAHGRLHRIFGLYVLCLLAFLAAMALAERGGLPRPWIGAIFLFSSLALYAGIGIFCRTSDAREYYVAGRSVPPIYNGMATAADWMSAASFISLAGGLYLQGFSGMPGQAGGLAYILGWTGGFCLVALLIAPALRRAEIYTVPDYFAQRFGGRWPRVLAALAAVLCSFTYVVAQIYGVGLIASRLTGVQFEIGILLGLGGVLVCSFLGGMRAVTWTQVAQYVILILAFLIPVSWLAYKQLGNPAAPFVYGPQLGQIAVREAELAAAPAERAVLAEFARRAAAYEALLRDVPAALTRERLHAQQRLQQLRAASASDAELREASRALNALPPTEQAARERWTRAMAEMHERARALGGVAPMATPFGGRPDGTPAERAAFSTARLNFLALMLCLMLGTAGLPHLLTRFFTTPSVAGARSSVAWSLLFISLLYIAAPALAVLVKHEVLSELVGKSFDDLPAWIAQWARVDPALVSVADVNGDRILQFAEIRLGADIIMLATPEIGGLPYVIAGLVAAGGLAAALSTADGLLLTMGNAFAHDLYLQSGRRRVGAIYSVVFSKFALLMVALAAAYVAAWRSADILYLVTASFSLAASTFFPALVAGILWRRTSRAGVVAGMLAGAGVTLGYMLAHHPVVRGWTGFVGPGWWFGIQPAAAGVFGLAAATVAITSASFLSRRSGL
ncbi:VC_2705 family sodium/solute symporter [Pseudorhodoferax soli]|uniref:Cation/acetate symporter n=1 Tax=Pseudorhodoferax soli TaxID=545864 RepID=A0A368Y6D0_9BURK|nr:VC_2705 family sodium/solute symporter [Pseudorhodoferax soli]RCW73764.1 cation/acetate symporter [Pseudorhodoferax soli]